MSFTSLIYDDCCLLTNIDLNSERILYILERRFKTNSNRTSFDFKSLSPEQPSNNTKVSRSLLRFQPKLKYNDDNEDSLSSESSSSEEDQEEVVSTNDDNDDDDDDYLDKLAEWEPDNFQPAIETDDENNDDDDDDDEEDNIFQTINSDNQPEPMEHSSAEDTPTTVTEDLFVTYSHRPVKSEPMQHDDNLPQLDGQIDFVSKKPSSSSTESNSSISKKNLDETIAKITAKNPKPNKTIQLHHVPPTRTRFRLNDDRISKPSNLSPKKSISIPDKLEQIKERTKASMSLPSKLTQIKERTKKIKKTKPSLLLNLLKTNEDAIRPLHTPVPITPTNISKTFRLSSNNRLSTVHSNPKMPVSNDDRISSFIKKQKSLPQNLKPSKPKSASHHMKLAEKNLNHFQKSQLSNSIPSSVKSKPKENITVTPKPSKSITSTIQKAQSITKPVPLNNQKVKKKLKRLDTEQSQIKSNRIPKPVKQKPIEDSIPTPPPQLEPTTESHGTTPKRSADFFKDCIVIDDDDDDDDDDIQEIERQPYSIAYNIRAREKLLDHSVHSSVMHMKWLYNLEYVLLQHITICHENNIRPSNENILLNSSNYQIEPSFISIIIINFLKMFMLRNSSNDQDEVSFFQYGLTSHLRYLLIELPTYNHNEEKDLNENCSKCHQYSLLINILFDLLFDLIEYDLCERNSKTSYRSSLIEEDYFTRFLPSNSSEGIHRFYRIKLVIYLLELIGIHMNKCQRKKQFQFNKNENQFFDSLEDFIRRILCHKKESINQRISICFNVMELCLLFVNKKEIRIKQMAKFLLGLCENNSTYLNLFLFDKNLFADVRLLLINELISTKYSMKFISIDHVQQFFFQIRGSFNSEHSIDKFVLFLLRSLFCTYADLILEIKNCPSINPYMIDNFIGIFRVELDLIYRNLFEISDKRPERFEETKQPLIFFRLLICKWNKL